MTDRQYVLSANEEYIVRRTQDYLSGSTPEPLTEDERQGLRAFLQRAETRLSTYQRVAGVFLNGAGLLVLLPTLARESIASTMSFAVQSDALSARALLLPWLLATLLPLYAFYLLLRDLVQFYFSPRFLESDPIRINRYSLAGVTLPLDEGPDAKAQVIALKVRDRSFADFILGGTSPETLKRAHRDSKSGHAAFPLRHAIMEALGQHRRDVELTSADVIGVSLSLAGSLDLTLVGEVARMEASVARHVLLLRKLVLRYSKALILFVWTTLILLTSVAVIGLHTLSDNGRAFVVFLLYTGWALLAVRFIKRPLQWIEELIPPRSEDTSQPIFRDPDLERFETFVNRTLRVAAVAFGALAVVAGIIALREI